MDHLRRHGDTGRQAGHDVPVTLNRVALGPFHGNDRRRNNFHIRQAMEASQDQAQGVA